MISTRGRYAIRVMIDLAENDSGKYIPLKDIAERQEISKKYLEIIMKDMVAGGLVAGAYVVDGKVSRTNKARLIRDGIVIFTGEINALKRFKDDVKEVSTNFECGISLTNCNDIREGDTIETYQEIEVRQKL